MRPNFEQQMARYKIEVEQEWRETGDAIPFISFPTDWQVKVIPPFGDAAVRFVVKLPSGMTKSIYLDVRDSLGFFGGVGNEPTPYWEVYPYLGDVGRCAMGDTKGLLEMIADETNVEAQTD